MDNLAQRKQEKKVLFVSFADIAVTSGGQITMIINDMTVDYSNFDEWPHNWRKLNLLLRYPKVIIEELHDHELEERIYSCACDLLPMILSLLPIDDEYLETEHDDNIIGLPEGAQTKIEVNKYERNRLNRTLCIYNKGVKCAVCSFDFANVYGDIGIDFIHVHHIVPVSTIGPNYVINPIRDLEPVCPNCHAMLHRKNPPYTVEELKARLALD